MPNLSPVIREAITDHCGCFADAPPMPMGCALCGHAPYSHGCPGRPSDHEYAAPSPEQFAQRLAARRAAGPHHLPGSPAPEHVAPAEVIPLVPAQRRRPTRTGSGWRWAA